VFPHHKEIVAHIRAQNVEMPENTQAHHEWIRTIVSDPMNVYTNIRKRFEEN
jgi:hypothetical protein